MWPCRPSFTEGSSSGVYKSPVKNLKHIYLMAMSSMGAHMHFVVGHAQAGERLANLVGGERAAAVPVKVRKRRRKVLLLQQEHML